MHRMKSCFYLAGFGVLLACGAVASAQTPGQLPAAKTPPQPQALANSAAEEKFQEQKKFAATLFNENHHLEALPIFQDLARQKPDDPDILFGLGACMLDHSMTLKDEAAAKAERVQSRELLLKARELGNNSTLLMNLLDVLPADGSVHYPGGQAASAELQQGEAAFAKNDYQDAIAHYLRAYKIDPKNYSAALFIGDSYFAQKDFVKASEWYQKAIEVNPDIETAYRYASDMYSKEGDAEKARTMAIRAVIAEPYNNLPWRGLLQWAGSNKVKLAAFKIDTKSSLKAENEKAVTVPLAPSGTSPVASVWLVYNGVRLNWQNTEFKKHFPQETAYRHSLLEEVDALGQAAKFASEQKSPEIEKDPNITILRRIADAGMLEPYVLLSAPDREISVDYAGYREKNRAKLEEYLNHHIVPPAPAATPGTGPKP